MARERDRMLTAAAISLALAGFTGIAFLLDIPGMNTGSQGMALAAVVAVVGMGIVVTRALADPAGNANAKETPGPSSDGNAPAAEAMDSRLAQRLVALGGCLVAAGILAAVRSRTQAPDDGLTAIFFGLLLGGGVLAGILAVRRVRPPLPVAPLQDLIGAHYGDLLEPSHIRVLHELVESGEVEQAAVLSAPYEEVAGWLEAKGERIAHEKNDWEKRVESQRRRRERDRPSQVMKRGGGGSPGPSRQPGRQQRGTR